VALAHWGVATPGSSLSSMGRLGSSLVAADPGLMPTSACKKIWQALLSATDNACLSRGGSRRTGRFLGAEDRVRHKVGGIAGDRRCDVGVEVKRYSDGGVSESF